MQNITMTESKFNMWRVIVSLVHADGVVTQEERTLIQQYLEKIPFTAPQKQTLETELKKGGPKIDDLLEKVTLPADRALVVHFATVLCYRDGDFHPDEKKIIDKLHANAISKTNLVSVMGEAKKQATEASYRAEHDRHRGLFERFFNAIGIELD